METTEQFFPCPFCGETISMVIDLSAGGQCYIEDCEVCCQPIEIRYSVEENEISFFEANRA